MKVAVTGASGFIGRAFCERLAEARLECMAIDLRRGVPRLEGVDVLVHLAAIAHARRADAAEVLRVNVELSAQLGRAAAAAGSRLIYVSSVKVHGEQTDRPLVESSEITPRDDYAASKAKAEEALRNIRGLRLTVLRPPLVYGSGVKANFLALMKLVASGIPLPFASIHNRRSLIFVGNLADALLRCVTHSVAEGRIYLVSDGEAISTPDLCRHIGGAVGRRARLFAFSPRLLELLPGTLPLTRSLEVEDVAVRQELGWRQPFSLAEGLSSTGRWFSGR